MSKHTPGPWRAEYNTVQVGEEWEPIAEVFAPNDDRATIAANINLIAAAPEMLVALKEAVSTFETGGIYGRIAISSMRAAIAKAEGRS